MRLKKIEKRILEIKNILADPIRRKEMARGMSMPSFEGLLKEKNMPLLDEKDRLETERQFILNRRDSLFWKIVWNGIVPVVVSIITVLVLKRFGLE